MVVEDPVAKFVEQNETAVVGVDLSEYLLCIRDRYALRLEQWHCLFEFFEGDPSIFAGVDVIKDTPIAVVVSEVLKEESELSLRDVVIAKLGGCFEFVFGHVEGPDDDRLELEEFRQPDDIPYALINLSQAQVPIAIDIEPRPIVIDLFYICRSISRWQFIADDLDNLARFHINYNFTYKVTAIEGNDLNRMAMGYL